VRAKQDHLGDDERRMVLPILIHGDAAFAGQGVVAETLNLSALPGYDVGGTVHIVVNNQLGFTTAPDLARSTQYATDIAKGVQAPIFHVNGDDPEAACRVIQLAFAFRQRFAKDVVVDLVCYRRYGHNEGDEPAFTQPRMYELIDARRSVRKLYTETLVNRGDLTLPECEATLEDYRARLEAAFTATHESVATPARSTTGSRARRHRSRRSSPAVSHERLEQVMTVLDTLPRRSPFIPSSRGSSRSAPRRSPAAMWIGPSPKHSPSARCCKRARRCASRARTPGGARSANAMPCSSTSTTSTSTRPSRTSRPSLATTTRAHRS